MWPPLTIEGDEGLRDAVLEEVRPVVGLQVVHADERRPGGERDAFRRSHPHQERPDEPGADRHGHAVEVTEPDPGRVERLLEQRVQRLDMRASGDLGHHAAEPLVQMDLGGDQVRTQT